MRKRLGAITILCALITMLNAGPGFAEDSASSYYAAVSTLPKKALWVVNSTGYDGYLSIFQGLKLKKSGAPRPTFAFTDNAGLGPPDGITFDAKHNLWLSFCSAGSIRGILLELTAQHLRQLVEFRRTRISAEITLPSSVPAFCFRSPQFDSAGNLWVVTVSTVSFGALGLLEYTPSQLAQSGAPIPNAILNVSEPSESNFFNAGDLRFDSTGDLWMSGGIIQGTYPAPYTDFLADLLPGQMSAGTNVAPNLNVLVSDAIPRNIDYFTTGLAFDQNGNAWVSYTTGFPGGSNYQGGLEEFAAFDLTGTGTISPTPVVTIGMLGIGSPDALAFDDLGDLWVANFPDLSGESGNSDIAEFTPDQLAASASIAPKVLLSPNVRGTNLAYPVAITFGPKIP
jgi:sugar lactone lactonase YvrE